MSSVRMCDRCGDIFSENSDGWTTMNGSQRRRDPATGETKTVTVQQDQCGRCSNRTLAPVRPELTAAGKADPGKIARLETELGLDPDDYDGA